MVMEVKGRSLWTSVKLYRIFHFVLFLDRQYKSLLFFVKNYFYSESNFDWSPLNCRDYKIIDSNNRETSVSTKKHKIFLNVKGVNFKSIRNLMWQLSTNKGNALKIPRFQPWELINSLNVVQKCYGYFSAMDFQEHEIGTLFCWRHQYFKNLIFPDNNSTFDYWITRVVFANIKKSSVWLFLCIHDHFKGLQSAPSGSSFRRLLIWFLVVQLA